MHLPDDQAIIITLKKHRAYVTQTRIAVLRVLSQTRGSISVSRIRKLSPVALDRVSIYRTLQLFLEKGLILIVPNSRGNPHYILTDFLKMTSANSLENQLVYFICKTCGHTELIEQGDSLIVKRPANHQVNNCYIVLEGICNRCISGGKS